MEMSIVMVSDKRLKFHRKVSYKSRFLGDGS
jgi:hypothetical protein